MQGNVTCSNTHSTLVLYSVWCSRHAERMITTSSTYCIADTVQICKHIQFSLSRALCLSLSLHIYVHEYDYEHVHVHVHVYVYVHVYVCMKHGPVVVRITNVCTS